MLFEVCGDWWLSPNWVDGVDGKVKRFEMSFGVSILANT
jgi:hypothetical protein